MYKKVYLLAVLLLSAVFSFTACNNNEELQEELGNDYLSDFLLLNVQGQIKILPDKRQINIDVKCDSKWTVTLSDLPEVQPANEWCKVTNEGQGNGTLIVQVEENTGLKIRDCEITVSTSKSSRSFSLHQYGKYVAVLPTLDCLSEQIDLNLVKHVQIEVNATTQLTGIQLPYPPSVLNPDWQYGFYMPGITDNSMSGGLYPYNSCLANWDETTATLTLMTPRAELYAPTLENVFNCMENLETLDLAHLEILTLLTGEEREIYINNQKSYLPQGVEVTW